MSSPFMSDHILKNRVYTDCRQFVYTRLPQSNAFGHNLFAYRFFCIIINMQNWFSILNYFIRHTSLLQLSPTREKQLNNKPQLLQNCTEATGVHHAIIFNPKDLTQLLSFDSPVLALNRLHFARCGDLPRVSSHLPLPHLLPHLMLH